MQRVACFVFEHRNGEIFGVRRGQYLEFVGLPAEPFTTENPTTATIAAAFCRYAATNIVRPRLRKIGELCAEWNRLPSILMVFEIAGIWIENIHGDTAFSFNPEFAPPFGKFDITVDILRQSRLDLARDCHATAVA